MSFRPLLLAAALAAGSSPTAASETYPFRPVHEAMTRLAYLCVAEATSKTPDCRPYFKQLKAEARFRFWRPFSSKEKAVTWPDDPVRELSLWTGIRYGIALKFTCAEDNEDPDAPAFTLEEGGLMCSSHHGALQFFHAMRSAPSETTAQTRDKVLDWAMLNYEIATHRVNVDQPYCGYFQGSRSDISNDLAPAGFSFCEDRMVDGRVMPAWRLRTLYVMRCRNLLLPSRCSEVTGEPGRELAVQSARGALLHVIQDSYSQSHVVRGLPPDPMASVVECRRPTGFHLYDQVNQRTHGDADAPPDLGASCLTGDLSDLDSVDAITASAQMLRFIIDEEDPAVVRRFLEDRVFG